MATQYAFGQTVTNGLVLSLDAADKNSYPGSGTVWTDLTSNSRIGTLTNSPTFNSANGGAIIFDGTNDYVSFSSINMAGLPLGFTAFVKPNAFGAGNSNNAIVRKGDNNPTDYAFSLRDSKVALGVEYADDATIPVGNTTLVAGNWYHLAASWNGTSVTFYVNGVNDGNVSLSATIVDDGKPTYVGGRFLGAGTGADIFNGSIASVQMYNRALSLTEVLQNYNAQKSRFGL